MILVYNRLMELSDAGINDVIIAEIKNDYNIDAIHQLIGEIS